jgi:hypothetical protein
LLPTTDGLLHLKWGKERVEEGGGRWRKVEEGGGRWRKVEEGGGRWRKVEEGGERWRKGAVRGRVRDQGRWRVDWKK